MFCRAVSLRAIRVLVASDSFVLFVLSTCIILIGAISLILSSMICCIFSCDYLWISFIQGLNIFGVVSNIISILLH